MNDNVDIFIYSHIPFQPIVTDPVYKVLTNNHADDSEFKTNLPIYRDYTGDNISDKNLLFNEYSGFYWLYKNWDIKDYIGMIHYRRYYKFLDDVPDFNEIFKTKKIVLNKRVALPRGNKEFYGMWHNINDFNLMGEIVKSKYPNMEKGWDTMSKINYIHPSSLFIMPKDLYNEYCSYIFDCLNTFNEERKCFTREDWIVYVAEHEDEYIHKERGEHKYCHVIQQARAVGFIAERCLMAFLVNGGADSLENNSLELDWGLLR